MKSRKRTRNSSAISRCSGAIFRNSGAIQKRVQSQSSALQSVCLHVFAFAIARALICHASSSKHLCITVSCRGESFSGHALCQSDKVVMGMTHVGITERVCFAECG